MNYGLLRSVVAMTAIGAGSLELSKAIINTFSFDIFAGCVDGRYAPTDNVCQYGPQMSINVLAMVFFFMAAAIMFNVNVRKSGKRPVAKIAVVSVAFMALLTLVWRIQLSLQDNFLLYAGPQTLEEYLYVGFVWADTVLIGIVLGLLWWLPERVNDVSVDASKRKEPRFLSGTSSKVLSTTATVAPAKKPASKKTTTKKSTASKAKKSSK